jgi:predicted N-acetyltransferase YhbS
LPRDFRRDTRARHDRKRHRILATTVAHRAPDGARDESAALTPAVRALRGFLQNSRGTAMSPNSITRLERPSDAAAVDALQHAAFGPGAYARAAFRVREQAPHDPTLSFLTEINGELVGSVRMTPIRVGSATGLLLGPLVVEPAHKGQGYGKALMRHVMDEARKAGWPFVILVGDQPYYWPFGFRPLPPKRVAMPGPVDPARLLVAELVPGAAAGLRGLVQGVRGEKSNLPAQGGLRQTC